MDPSRTKMGMAPILDGPEDHHVYIANSECNDDHPLVEKIITYLKKKQLKFIDPENFYPKDKYDFNKVEDGVGRSKHVLILLTKSFLGKLDLLSLVSKTSQRKAEESNDSLFLILALADGTEADVPKELLGYKTLTVTHPNFEADLVQIMATEFAPEMAVLSSSGIAKGLAWSYFYGYLRMLLPGLPERYKKFGVWKDAKGDRRMPLKMFILIPASCYCPPSLTDKDEKFKLHPEKIPFLASRAGCQNRNYNTTVYSVEDDNGQCYYAQIEFATPVLSMYEMYNDEIAGMREADKDQQLRVFYNVLRDILKHEKNEACHDRAILLYYDDSDTSVPLSRVVLNRIKREIERDIENENKETKCGEDTVIAIGEKPTYRQEKDFEILPKYDMQRTTEKRGKAVIFSVIKYSKDSGFESRPGSEVDEDKMEQMWKYLDFDVEVVQNPKGMEMMKKAQRIASEDHTRYKAFVCCFLGHGDMGAVFGSDGRRVRITDLTHIFSEESSESLANKPKMFFIQACQTSAPEGLPGDTSVVQRDAPTRKHLKEGNQEKGVTERKNRALLVPSNKDFVMSYATLPGTLSFRHKEGGSYYVDILDKTIRERPDIEIGTILKIVSHKVQIEMKKLREDDKIYIKQLPFSLATTNKQLYL